MLLSFSFFVSFLSTLRNNLNSSPTSSLGRFMFSLLKAKRVRVLTPILAQCLTTLRTLCTPFWCPLGRGKPLDFAQRPLPSIIMAICFGGALTLFIDALLVELIERNYTHRACETQCKVSSQLTSFQGQFRVYVKYNFYQNSKAVQLSFMR